MTSFFGGQPGQGFIIRKSYISISAMQTAFTSGDLEPNVWYGDYVLIDTVNKNDADNGKIYKRVAGTTAATCAEYLGQIVGPATGLPYVISENSIDDPDDRLNETYSDYTEAAFYYLNDVGEQTLYRGNIIEKPKEKEIYTQSLTTDQGLVPGYTPGTEPTYQDTIDWKWCSIRTADASNDASFYIGFQFPYSVITFTGESFSGYNSQGDYTTDIDLTDNGTYTDGKRDHPFYYPFSLKIPRGIRAERLDNIRHEAWNAGGRTANQILLPEAFTVVSAAETGYKPGQLKVDTDIHFTEDSTLKSGYEVWLYELHDYSKNIDGRAYTVYGGVYSTIGDIAINDRGTITKTYTAKNTETEADKILWIDNCHYDSSLSKLLISSNHSSFEASPYVYDETQTYTLNACIIRKGIVYKCITAIATPEPWTSAHWTAKQYDATTTYAADELVNYNGSVYKSNTAITTAEAWEPAHWDLLSIGYDMVDTIINTVQDMAINVADYHARVLYSDPMLHYRVATLTEKQNSDYQKYMIDGSTGSYQPVAQSYVDAHLTDTFYIKYPAFTDVNGNEHSEGYADLGVVKGYDGILIGKNIKQSELPIIKREATSEERSDSTIQKYSRSGSGTTEDPYVYTAQTQAYVDAHTEETFYINAKQDIQDYLIENYPNGLTGNETGKIVIYTIDEETDIAAFSLENQGNNNYYLTAEMMDDVIQNEFWAFHYNEDTTTSVGYWFQFDLKNGTRDIVIPGASASTIVNNGLALVDLTMVSSTISTPWIVASS